MVISEVLPVALVAAAAVAASAQLSILATSHQPPAPVLQPTDTPASALSILPADRSSR